MTISQTPATEFDRDIAVTPIGEGRCRGVFRDGWRVGGGINGGFQLAVLGNAIRAALPDQPDPIAVSAYYLARAVAGDVEVDVTVRRLGGRTPTAAADLRQDGQSSPGCRDRDLPRCCDLYPGGLPPWQRS